MLKETQATASQVRRILSPCSGGLSPEAVKGLLTKGDAFYTKYGTDLSAVFADAAQRGGGVLVLNLAGDDDRSPLNAHLAESQQEKLELAVKAVAEAAGIQEVYVVKPPELAYQPQAIDVKTIDAARCAVLREEYTLYHLMETGELRSCPMEKDFPSQGYQNRPTILADAETFCRIYEAAASDGAPSKLVVIKDAKESCLTEVKTGTPVAALLSECGFEAEKGVLAGGVLGEYIPAGDLAQRTIENTADWDSIRVYGKQDCLAQEALQLAQEAKQDSCGKCVLCREGTWHFLGYTKDITGGKAKKEDLAMLLDIAPLIRIGAFCSFGQKMARAIGSLAEHNRAELEAHITKKTCPAGVCSAFSKLVIDPAKCTGCGDCLDVCEEDAITGKKKFIHMIDADMCENCGECQKACEEGAVVMQDGTIRVPKKLVRVGKFK
ncbi:MAG: 4Fe-4S binding protein [Eubacterium sp.]|nr:4Fe-4S binding protein [Eubacterium sp.]